jgi:hypothetical protein
MPGKPNTGILVAVLSGSGAFLWGLALMTGKGSYVLLGIALVAAAAALYFADRLD